MKQRDALQTIRKGSLAQLKVEIVELRKQPASNKQTRRQIARRLTVIKEMELVNNE